MFAVFGPKCLVYFGNEEKVAREILAANDPKTHYLIQKETLTADELVSFFNTHKGATLAEDEEEFFAVPNELDAGQVLAMALDGIRDVSSMVLDHMNAAKQEGDRIVNDIVDDIRSLVNDYYAPKAEEDEESDAPAFQDKRPK